MRHFRFPCPMIGIQQMWKSIRSRQMPALGLFGAMDSGLITMKNTCFSGVAVMFRKTILAHENASFGGCYQTSEAAAIGKPMMSPARSSERQEEGMHHAEGQAMQWVAEAIFGPTNQLSERMV